MTNETLERAQELKKKIYALSDFLYEDRGSMTIKQWRKRPLILSLPIPMTLSGKEIIIRDRELIGEVYRVLSHRLSEYEAEFESLKA